MEKEQLAREYREAQALLDNPRLRAALEETKALYVTQWESADTPERREAAWQGRHAVDEFERVLRRIIARGAKEAAELDRR